MTDLSEVFYTFLITSIIGLILAMGRIIYKSKCSHITCCGCEIERNVDIEEPEVKYKNIYSPEESSKEESSKEEQKII